MAHYMQTYTGKQYDPLNPSEGYIDLEDIAKSLSNICRFNGHCQEFYSVSQHCVLVSQVVPKEDALSGLMHDSGETYLGDIIRPLKRGLPEEILKRFKEIEKINLEIISKKFGFKYPFSKEVKHADDRVLATELRDLMKHRVPIIKEGTKTVTTRVIALKDTIVPVGPTEAYQMFMERYNELVIVEK